MLPDYKLDVETSTEFVEGKAELVLPTALLVFLLFLNSHLIIYGNLQDNFKHLGCKMNQLAEKQGKCASRLHIYIKMDANVMLWSGKMTMY